MSSTRTTKKQEPTLAERLAAPFPTADIEWRVSRAGKKDGRVWAQVVAYVTARAIMERLDEVFGLDGWKEEFRAGPAGGVICRIHFRMGEEWLWREDGAENTDFESVKGGLSNARKRAAAALGIGRYLYRIGDSWAEVHGRGEYYGRTKEGEAFRWDPPVLPAFALPEIERGNGQKASNRNVPRSSANGQNSTKKAPARRKSTKKDTNRVAAGPGLQALQNAGRA